jgi:hypothetical protein
MVRNRIAALVAVFALLSGNALFSAQCQGGACKGRKAAGRKAGAKAAKGQGTALTRKATATTKALAPMKAARPGMKSFDVVETAWDKFAEDNNLKTSKEALKVIGQFLDEQVGVKGKTMFLGQYNTALNTFAVVLSKIASEMVDETDPQEVLGMLPIAQAVIDYINSHSKGNYAPGVNKMQQALNETRQDIQGYAKTGEQPDNVVDIEKMPSKSGSAEESESLLGGGQGSESEEEIESMEPERLS